MHAYPTDLARYAEERWRTLALARPLPPAAALEQIVSTAFQASLLREEERAVTFRLLVADPDELAASEGPPSGLHRLVFDTPRPLTEHELRRLSPAAKYHRSLVGVRVEGGVASIWGVVHSGPRWLQTAHGERGGAPPVFDALTVHVTGPGRMAIACGATTVAELRGGRLTDLAMDVFTSRWLPARFADVRRELAKLHAIARASVDEPWSELEDDVMQAVAQQLFKRVVTTIRAAHHGGTVIVLPSGCAEDILAGRYLRLKYAFRDEEARRRYRHLILAIMRTLAASRQDAKVDWGAYQSSPSHELAALDEGVFELAHLVAGLAVVDGAVAMTKRFELLGFGGEIAGPLPEVSEVFRALDLEGTRREREVVDDVGTRHRSAYRLCARFHDAIAVVVSQDGGVRLVAWKDDAVMYWDHAAVDSG